MKPAAEVSWLQSFRDLKGFQGLKGLCRHARTVIPHIRGALRQRLNGDLPHALWTTTLQDPDVGQIQLSGEMRCDVPSDTIVILLHGLGSGPSSHYCRDTAAALERRGVASLSLALRGADRRGEDFYNVGQTADLHAAIASPALASFRNIYVLGFSMGGHVALHLAADIADPRLRAIAAVCSPLELNSVQRFIDAPAQRFYRNNVLDGLKRIYAAVAARRPVPTPVEVVQRARSIFEWDEVAIAPRYGFDGARHSYDSLSVAPRLAHLRRPALLIAAEDDPMISADLIREHMPSPSAGLDVCFAARAGHVAFPRHADFGFGADRGLTGQILAWFRQHDSAANITHD